MLGKIVSALDHNEVHDPKRVLLLGMINGGTTAVSKCMLQHPEVTVVSNTMKTQRISSLELNIGQLQFYYGGAPTKVLYNKEPIGNPESMYLPPEDYSHLENFFVMLLYRDPVYVWNSWKKRRYKRNLERMINCYNQLNEYHYDVVVRGINHVAICFENFLTDPEKYLRNTCKVIGIEYHPGMTEWSIPWGDRMGKKGNPNIDKEPLKDSVDQKLVVPERDVLRIKKELGAIYSHVLENY